MKKCTLGRGGFLTRITIGRQVGEEVKVVRGAGIWEEEDVDLNANVEGQGIGQRAAGSGGATRRQRGDVHRRWDLIGSAVHRQVRNRVILKEYEAKAGKDKSTRIMESRRRYWNQSPEEICWIRRASLRGRGRINGDIEGFIGIGSRVEGAAMNAGADSNARIHCGQTWKVLGLSSFKFQCELVGRRAGGRTHEWGSGLTDGDEGWSSVYTRPSLNRQGLFVPHAPTPPRVAVLHASPILASTPWRWRLQFSLALALMFQHSQQPAPVEFSYHADLLGDTHSCCSAFLSPSSLSSSATARRPTPDAHAQAAAASFHSRNPAITLLLHSVLLSRIPHLFLFSTLTLQVLLMLLHSCAALLTLLLRRPDTHAPACPHDLAPLALYALHSVGLPPSPAVSITIMISISHPALLAPRGSLSLGLLRLELFRSCFRFRSGSLSLVARIYAIRSESIPDPPLFIPVLAFFRLDALASSTRGSLAGTPGSCFLDPAFSAPLRLLN
ncbi:hypothetical protein B0H13DRAFT_1903623 [Mycena leptocephala]|nr:hypothetical protein B0H13DRAFT_1903623 [Mycena leptocephala]